MRVFLPAILILCAVRLGSDHDLRCLTTPAKELFVESGLGLASGLQAVCFPSFVRIPSHMHGRDLFYALPVYKNNLSRFYVYRRRGSPPYTWSASAPWTRTRPGAGQLTGTPTEAGSYAVIISLSDSRPMPSQASASYAVDVASTTGECAMIFGSTWLGG